MLLGTALVGCISTQVSFVPQLTPASRPTQLASTLSSSVDRQLREAFRIDDPIERRASVLRLTELFLRNPAVAQMTDEAVSLHYTNIAFSSGQLVFSDPAFIRREADRVVVGLPNAMGLYFYDLSRGLGTSPLELSAWAVGLSMVHAYWGEGELGVGYITLGNDAKTRAHYLLVKWVNGSWYVAWFSDEEPGWWFNAQDATVAVVPDLSALAVVGESSSTTLAFDERGLLAPRRRFRVEWVRRSDRYVMRPPLDSHAARQAWLWQVAEPSAYATLVEFIERLQLQDERNASQLVTEPSVMTAAIAFGLYLPQRRYEVLLSDEQGIIVFGDHLGTFVASFSHPQATGAPWQITSLQPVGADFPDSIHR